MAKATVVRKTVRSKRVRQTEKASFDRSAEAQKERAERRTERLAVLAPLGMTHANYIQVNQLDGIRAVAEKVGKGNASKAEKVAVQSVIDRIRANSLRLTPKSKAVTKPFAFAEELETLANLA